MTTDRLDDLAFRAARAACCAGTVWIGLSHWIVPEAMGLLFFYEGFPSWSLGYWDRHYACRLTNQVYGPALVLLLLGCAAPLATQTKRAKWPVWACAGFAALTWLYFSLPVIRE
jgi:hypothetical protein